MSTAADQPLRLELEVFPHDRGFGYRFKLWVGDVIPTKTKPTAADEQPGFRTHRAALLGAHRRVGQLLVGLART